jgi:hypothetical protein
VYFQSWSPVAISRCHAISPPLLFLEYSSSTLLTIDIQDVAHHTIQHSSLPFNHHSGPGKQARHSGPAEEWTDQPAHPSCQLWAFSKLSAIGSSRFHSLGLHAIFEIASAAASVSEPSTSLSLFIKEHLVLE